VPAKSRRSAVSSVTNEPAYSPGGVADALGVDERTVRRWIEAKVIPAEDTVAGHHLVSESTLQALQQLVRDKVPLNARTLRGRFSQEARKKTD
jgi:excisionase family DNA binding protein